MPINLVTEINPARTVKYGASSFDMDAGEWLKIQKADEFELKERVPTGKKWKVYVETRIVEEDA